jgi:hypothetical protein
MLSITGVPSFTFTDINEVAQQPDGVVCRPKKGTNIGPALMQD